jgi:hypothetical protein
MTPVSDKPRHTQRVAIALIVVVGAITTVFAYLGTRDRTLTPGAPVPETAANLTVQTIVLPHDEPELPSGPHQRTFATHCTICHSLRLVLTQPQFGRKKWEEVVHKMVKTYGAPISPETEAQIAEYLTTVHGE